MPGSTDPAIIRNFCIIAHIDHGKSTLADRMLQLTGVVDDRSMRAQYLDRMDIERERGITIKSQAVRMPWIRGGCPYVLNMIDTPGHVDFTYEVSRSLAACEGAVLLVDAAQGIEAQTLANLYLALEADLHIIPVLNKIDLPSAQPEKYAAELATIIGGSPGEVLQVSAKTGDGVTELLDAIVAQVPAPVGDPDAPARALIFDSVYDTYRGVVTYVRVVDGELNHRDRILMMSTKATHEVLEVGVIAPEPVKASGIGVGEVGYVITGVKDVRQSRVGDTVTLASRPAEQDLGGYRHPNPMVYAGLYPIDGDDFAELREALEKLQLNDAALAFEPETSAALGFGFRIGFLGLLHMEIVRERLEREFNLDLISTAPNVVYRVVMEPDRLHRHLDGALSGSAGRSDRDGLPLGGPGRVALHAALGRDRLRLFRRLEVAYQGIRLTGLRAVGGAAGRPGQGGYSAAWRRGRCVQFDRASGQGLRLWGRHDREAAWSDPSPAVRGSDPGGDRGPGDRSPDRTGGAQRCAGEVLWR